MTTKSAAPAIAIRARGLTKAYHIPPGVRRASAAQGKVLPDRVAALDRVDFTVHKGEVYGVLGPNGAGKTTLMRLLGTILLPDEGEVEMLGQDLVAAAPSLRGRIGLVLGEYERSFHWRLTGRQNLAFFADFYAIPKNEAQARIDAVLETVDLLDAGDTRFDAYSTGMKHRLALARGLLPNPEILLLDEPTAGLDAASSDRVAEVVRERAAAGTAIVYTTHRLHEAGALCDRILILDQGRPVAESTPEELGRLAKGARVVEVTSRAGPWAKTFVEPIAAIEGVRDWETRGGRLLFYLEPDDAAVQRVVEAVRASGPEDAAVTVRPPGVEDAFHVLTTKEASA